MKHHRFSVNGPTGKAFNVRFRVNPRAKRLIMRLDPKSGEAVITAPKNRDFSAAKKFAAERAGWLEAQSARLPEELSLKPGAIIPFRGIPHRLTRSAETGKIHIIAGEPPSIDCPGAEITFADRLIRFFRMEARRDITAAVDHHAARLGAQPSGITIRDTRSRWGSCSSKGNLNFSWRLILAPPEVLDYVAAHEVAHLIEMNHSPAFWAQVEKTYGPHTSARNWLKRHGASLHAVGSSGSFGG